MLVEPWRSLRRERARAARRRARRQRAGASIALLGIVAVAVVLVAWHHAGPEPAHAHAPAVRGPAPARPIAVPGPARGASLPSREDRAVERVRSYTPFVTAGGRRRREVALTFDDGPGPYTPRVLAELRHLHAPATLFEVGFMVDYFHASTVAARRDGFAIGDHTETHPFMGRLSATLQREQLVAQARRLGRYGVAFPRLFRPPYGSFNRATFAQLGHLGMLMVLWTVDTGDYARPGNGAIVDRALRGARPGAIILLHDAGGNRTQTIAALPQIVRGLRARGYRLVTVPELMLDDPPPHHQHLPTTLAGG